MTADNEYPSFNPKRLEPHAYRHATPTKNNPHDARPSCPCYYCHRPANEHAERYATERITP